mmetsp:Transcript_7020/g.15463  ORF Transcript_7020/g.15463 Transcript_7020/m.15463 type:complete len:151 (+) Transcript_7020:1058-1510(+)
MTLALLVEEEPRSWTSHSWYQHLGAQLAGELHALAAPLAAEAKAPQAKADACSYVYLSHLTLALKSTLKGSRALRGGGLGAILMHAMADLKRNQAREVAARSGEGWVVAKTSAGGDLFMVAENKHLSLTEAHSEASSLCKTSLGHVFLDG